MEEHTHCQASPDNGHQFDEESGVQYGREQDRLLPIANVSRLMKMALPANAKISKEAKEMVQECVSEFISFITGEASDKCSREKRKTVNGDDLIWAMGILGFKDYLQLLKGFLCKYREIEGERATMTKQGEQGMGKDVGALIGSLVAVMGADGGAISSTGMPGSMQMIQSYGGYIHPQEQYGQELYHMQFKPDGGGGAGRPNGGGGQLDGT